jgi:hypothetical protein
MLTAERARELFDYDPDTGVICWRKSLNPKRIKDGSAILPHKSNMYGRVGVDGKHYSLHRVAWLLSYGQWPDGLIDHINGNPLDNRLCNLRVVNHTQNRRNSKRPITNKSGFKGVCFEKKPRRWRAYVYVNRKRIHIGYFDTPEEAHLAYCAAAATHFGEHFCDGTREHERA